MDSTDNSAVIFASQITEWFHDWCCSEGVKTSCWLIKEDQVWVCDKFHTNRCSLSFTSRNTLYQRTSNSGVLAFVQFKSRNEIIDTGNFLCQFTWQFQLCSKLKALSYCHSLEQDIVLLNIGRIWGEVLDLIFFDSIELDRSCLIKIFGYFSSREIV